MKTSGSKIVDPAAASAGSSMEMKTRYVHGYSPREAERLHDQASSVRELFHHDTRYSPGSTVLEAGCGVGAHTATLAGNSAGATFVSVDIALDSIRQAKRLVRERGLSNVWFQRADILALPFSDDRFDHVWVSHIVEHVSNPVDVLAALRHVIKPGGTITVIEGDHGSCYFHPETTEALRAWRCLIDVQARMGGNSLIGRQVFPLLVAAGLREVRVSPRMVYADWSTPELKDAFVRKTIIPMVEGVREKALALRLMDEAEWEKGIADLHAVADRDDGTFCYTFFKAVGIK